MVCSALCGSICCRASVRSCLHCVTGASSLILMHSSGIHSATRWRSMLYEICSFHYILCAHLCGRVHLCLWVCVSTHAHKYSFVFSNAAHNCRKWRKVRVYCYSQQNSVQRKPRISYLKNALGCACVSFRVTAFQFILMSTCFIKLHVCNHSLGPCGLRTATINKFVLALRPDAADNKALAWNKAQA